jgi:hypothetical protein
LVRFISRSPDVSATGVLSETSVAYGLLKRRSVQECPTL